MGSHLIDVEMETSHKLGWMGRGQGLVRLGHRAAPGDHGLCCVCRRFGTKCAGCAQGISPSDLVRKARSKVFHLNCFTCMVCNKQLSTGEELYVIDENKFVCKDDYLSSSSLKEGSLNSGRRPLLLPCPRPECPPAMPSLARSTFPLRAFCAHSELSTPAHPPGSSRARPGLGEGTAFRVSPTGYRNTCLLQFRSLSQVATSPSLELRNSPTPSPTFEFLPALGGH